MIWHFIKSKPAPALAPTSVPAHASSLVPASRQDQMIISIIPRGFNTARWSDISLGQNQLQRLLLLLFLLLFFFLFLLLFPCPLHIYCQDQMIRSIINLDFNTARWSDISLSQNLLLILLLLLFLLLLLLLLLLLCLHLAPFSLHMLCQDQMIISITKL